VRLRVLAAAAEAGFVTTQVVIDSLGLSQSSASRHRSKRYHADTRRINEICDMLNSFVDRRNA